MAIPICVRYCARAVPKWAGALPPSRPLRAPNRSFRVLVGRTGRCSRCLVREKDGEGPNNQDEHRRWETVVGLLALQSSLNDNVKPAVYITPDNFLVAQIKRSKIYDPPEWDLSAFTS
ncbi:hypothetical protein IE4771_PC00352 (plasmid) [Rhizobium etli bv. mimosae str. IE4771]|uniref:Uncharacterized protein n=1 Tax=Rhizobium etli bv. mimosae str. IE4771 TaxID=1432050 RepID=A0A060I9I2_RHIET|nr:hypothetical protein IE4771_PC00352 [Rhizobium sp. IE4771]